MAVTTSLSGGTLTITGDADSDDIAIVGTANPGEITVTGRNDTFVDGVMNGSTTLQGVTADLIANFGGGDNVINVDNVYLAGELDLDTGNGNDQVIFGATGVVSSAERCSVNTGDGNDLFLAKDYKVFIADRLDVHLGGRGQDSAVLIGASALTSVRVSGGAFDQGRNDVFLQGVTSGGRLDVQAETPINNVAVLTSAASGDLRVYCRSGQNSIYIDTCYSAERIVVDSWTSNTPFFPHFPPDPITAPYNIDDTVTVVRCQTPLLFVNTTGDANPTYFGGNDTVTIDGNNLVGPPVANPGAHVLSVKTGDGNDQVSASYNVILGVAFVGLDELDDTLTLVGNLVTGIASGDGGTGTNRLNLFGNQFGGSSFTQFI
ncbi:MAG: hypothetical protein WD894_21715 [Pirellulales bacterium]